MARVDCRAKGVDMIDHADKTWLREPLVTRPERGLLHPDFSPEGDIRVDRMYRALQYRPDTRSGEAYVLALAERNAILWFWERKAWAEFRKRRDF